MAKVKKIVAVTQINHDGNKIMPGDVIDSEYFTKDQLTRFYERGVIRIEEVDVKDEEEKSVVPPVKTPAKTPEAPKVETKSNTAAATAKVETPKPATETK